jgi:putative Holliday junction resolvase
MGSDPEKPTAARSTRVRRAIGVDLGAHRVGVAVADEIGAMAHARPYLDGRDVSKLLDGLRDLAKAEGIVTFVVGLPRSMDGSEGMAARKARRFATLLAKHTGARVEFWDERLSSVQATSKLREQGLDARQMKGRIDSAAAAILLQSWLDRTDRRASPSGS